MSQISDLVHDSRLSTRFLSDNTIHTYFESTTVFNRRARRQKRVETWVRSKELGRGSFGIVWLEQCPKEDRLRAVKEIAKKKIQKNAYHRELEAIVKFSHARYDGLFVRSFGWYENPDSVFIAMEYILFGDLQKHLKRALPEDEAAQVVRQVLEGLECMHDNGFAHRDLKPENIFVVSKPPDKWWVKIGDFGISKRVAHGVTELRTINGTPGFIAPEVALKQLYEVDVDESSYDFTVDLWSLGVIAFYMLTTKHPFLKLESLISYARGDLAMSELCLKYSVINEEASSFLGRLMAPKAEDRGTATEALQHNWLPKDDESLPGSPQRHTPALNSASLVPHKADASSESEPEVSTFTTMKSATRHTIRRDSSSESEPEVVRFTTMDQSAYDNSQSGYPSETGPEIPTEADTEAKVPEERPQSKEPVLQRAINEGSGASTIRPKAQHPEEVSHDTKMSRTVRSGALPKERRRPPASQQPTSWISKLTSWKSPKTSLRSPMVSSEKSSKPDSPSNKQQSVEKTERVLRRRPKEPEGSLAQRHLEGPDSGEKPDHQWSHPNATRYIRESGSYGKIIKANNTEPTAIHVHSDSSVQQEPSNKLASRPKRPDTPPPPAVTAVRYANENTHPPAPVDPYAVDPYASYPVQMPSKTPEPSTTRSRRPDTPPPMTAVHYANNTAHPHASIDTYAVDPYANYPAQVPPPDIGSVYFAC
ncbi:hypothetical protein N7541_006286 [Penicillium brevicompactum]|uniref:Serine/threonine-protein kinase ATG1 n=1 Tax=Penicillium brevicompactum TaxID=5074 RepID=A0A9W9R4S7_PENBR|nr:hypothetical protein N7541_006286 [Penicillium brevicompactum]